MTIMHSLVAGGSECVQYVYWYSQPSTTREVEPEVVFRISLPGVVLKLYY